MQGNDADKAVNTGLQGGFDIRTDLALEQRESFEGDGGEISGVKLKEWHHQKSQVKLTEVKILNDQGAKAMGKMCIRDSSCRLMRMWRGPDMWWKWPMPWISVWKLK